MTSHPAPTRRDELVAIAREVIATDGPDRFELATIADRAGITPPALYRHFRDRQGILLAVLEQHMAELTAEFQSALASGEPDEQLERFLANQATWLDGADPGELRLLLWGVLAAAGDQEVAGVVGNTVDSLLAFLRETGSDAVDRDVLTAMFVGTILLRALDVLPQPSHPVFEALVAAPNSRQERA